MACGEVSFKYTLFTCEGVEENAFTGKDGQALCVVGENGIRGRE